MLIATGNKLVLKKVETPKKEGLLIVPDEKNNDPILAKVISVGCISDFFMTDEMVLVGPYTQKIMHEGEEYLVIKEDDVICKVL